MKKLRQVGVRRAPDPLGASSVRLDTKAQVQAWRDALNTPFVPRGVYRFVSHEEADQWLWQMITRPKKP